IDFIDMEDRRNNAKVERKLKEALSNDRARIQVGRISMFGLMELSRQRLNPSLTEAQFQKCAHCEGIGYVRTVDSAAITALRALEEEGIRGRSVEVILHLPNEVAIYILNNKRDMMDDIERRYGFRILIRTDEALAPDNHKIDLVRGTPVMAAPVAGVSSEGISTETSAEDDALEEEYADDEETGEGTREGAREGGREGRRDAGREGGRESRDDADGNGERRRRGRRGGRNRRGRGREEGYSAPTEGAMAAQADTPVEGGFGENFEEGAPPSSESADGEGNREGGRARRGGREGGREGGRGGRGRYGRDRRPREGQESRPREGQENHASAEGAEAVTPQDGSADQPVEAAARERQPRRERGPRTPREGDTRPSRGRDQAAQGSSDAVANDSPQPAAPERQEIKIVRHGARSASAEAPVAPPAPKEYEVVSDTPTEKKKGWWNRLVE
ncbi:MAG TPA: ribonuclease E/G, partial [Micavibrio sp.]